MAEATPIEIKRGLGTTRNGRDTIRVWHVVINGKTRASMTTIQDAEMWVTHYMASRDEAFTVTIK